MPVGHDEYQSAGERTNVEAARAAGVHIAIFSGNHGFWKTRWENSIDGSGAPYRTLVCYKETHANAVIDPSDPPTWPGTSGSRPSIGPSRWMVTTPLISAARPIRPVGPTGLRRWSPG